MAGPQRRYKNQRGAAPPSPPAEVGMEPAEDGDASAPGEGRAFYPDHEPSDGLIQNIIDLVLGAGGAAADAGTGALNFGDRMLFGNPVIEPSPMVPGSRGGYLDKLNIKDVPAPAEDDPSLADKALRSGFGGHNPVSETINDPLKILEAAIDGMGAGMVGVSPITALSKTGQAAERVGTEAYLARRDPWGRHGVELQTNTNLHEEAMQAAREAARRVPSDVSKVMDEAQQRKWAAELIKRHLETVRPSVPVKGRQGAVSADDGTKLVEEYFSRPGAQLPNSVDGPWGPDAGAAYRELLQRILGGEGQ